MIFQCLLTIERFLSKNSISPLGVLYLCTDSLSRSGHIRKVEEASAKVHFPLGAFCPIEADRIKTSQVQVDKFR